MARDYRAPNITARRLGMYLQIEREQVCELSYPEAVGYGCSAEWLARAETGFAEPPPDDVERMLIGYGRRDSRVAKALIDMAARQAGPPWLAAHAGRISASERDILTMEAEASVIRAYRFRHIPTLYYGRLGFRFAGDFGVHIDLPDWAPAGAAQVYPLSGYEPCFRGRVDYPPAIAALSG